MLIPGFNDRKIYDRDLANLALFCNQFLAYSPQVNSAFGVCWLASSEVINQVLFTPEHRPARKILKKTIIFLFSVNRTNRTVNFTGFTSNCVSQWESFLFNEQKSWRFPTLSRWVEWKYKYTWKWWTNRNGKKGYLDHCDWRLDFLRAVQIKP